jgi:hypothetical protein
MRNRLPWVIAVGALVLSSAGGAVAASQITGADVKNSSLTGKDVKNKSLTRADFSGSVAGPQGPRGAQGAAGPSGPQGAQGAQGPQGPAGPSALSAMTVQSGGLTVAAGDVDGGTIFCPPGQRVISGGYVAIAADGEVFASIATDDRTGWILLLDNFDSALEGELDGEAYCAAAGQAVAASPDARARSEARAQAMIDRLVAERRASHR